MGVVTTSLVVNLGTTSSDEAVFTAEIDGRDNGLNKGKTSFAPGDSIYILLFMSSNVQLLDAISSQGSLVAQGTTDFAVDDFAQFANEKESSLNYPLFAQGSSIMGGTSVALTTQWLGNDLGNYTVQNESKFVLSASDAQLGDPYVGVMKYSYNTKAYVYLLQNTLISGVDQYPIVCYFKGQTV